MIRRTISVSLCLSGFILVSLAGPGVPARAAAAPGGPLAQKMLDALKAQDRVQLRGTMTNVGSPVSQYLMRFQAQDREYIQVAGGPYARMKMHKKPVSIRSILIGRSFWATADGVHWSHGERKVAPTVLDVLSLNQANLPCCVAQSGSSVSLADLGTGRWHSKQVRILRFSLKSGPRAVTGHVYLDPSSSLPVGYSETNRGAAKTLGSFTISYGGSFSIDAPAK